MKFQLCPICRRNSHLKPFGHPLSTHINPLFIHYSPINHWLVVYLPLWKMMEWKSVGIIPFPTEWKVIKLCSSHHQPDNFCWWNPPLKWICRTQHRHVRDPPLPPQQRRRAPVTRTRRTAGGLRLRGGVCVGSKLGTLMIHRDYSWLIGIIFGIIFGIHFMVYKWFNRDSSRVRIFM